ncbi:BlaI/MecI/CopY family transcriptional regulator [Candidatus Woesearchaeota archaeon]|nr:BlaI/MecI/CopY family transcriptional regulator [Candidatus Woesearchaeota archaeon]
MNISILEDIGLTNAEIKVYLALLEIGSSTAGPIIEKSQLQSSVVHMTLNKLVEKGLLSFVKEGQRKHYQAANPQHITDYLDEKKKRFEQILPELMLKQELAKQKSEVIAFKGIKGIKELLLELLEAGGSEHHTFGSSSVSLMINDAWWVNYHKKRAEKGITAKLLFNASLVSWKAESKYPKSEVRYTKAGFEPLTETIIRNDKIGIIIWTEKPMGTLIHSKEAADSYEQFFQMLWGRANTTKKK